MSDFRVEKLDHVHVEVVDRDAAADWFGHVLGLVRAQDFTSWSEDPRGPLFLKSQSGHNCLALFARPESESQGDHTIAFRVDGTAFIAFVNRLSTIEITRSDGHRLTRDDIVDHELSWSIYFKDQDGNRFELTTYDYAGVGDKLKSAIIT